MVKKTVPIPKSNYHTYPDYTIYGQIKNYSWWQPVIETNSYKTQMETYISRMTVWCTVCIRRWDWFTEYRANHSLQYLAQVFLGHCLVFG